MLSKTLSTVVVVSTLFLTQFASADGPKITAMGSAKVERRPDYVDINLGLDIEQSSAAAAQAMADATMKAVVASVRALKLSDEDLQTGRVSLSPRYEEKVNAEGSRKVVAYIASNSLRIRTSDFKAVAAVIDSGLAAGANRIDGVNFGIKEALAAREEALTLATRAARSKAAVMAAALDLKVTGVIEATTASRQNWNAYSNFAQNARSESGGGGEEEGSVVPGTIEVWSEATVTFAAASLNP
ncbi:MAG: SIMPL domain-containing protein [Planctomycetota bacterium]|nr:SIMPL domain-containing protein [Planctomycetota bacterium]